MRRSLVPVCFSLLAACGDDGVEVDLCQLGEQAYREALAELRVSQPACQTDDECVHISTDVHCNGFSSSRCGAVVHRDAASRWNEREVCAESDSYPPAKFECAVEASCEAIEPACVQGRCSERH